MSSPLRYVGQVHELFAPDRMIVVTLSAPDTITVEMRVATSGDPAWVRAGAVLLNHTLPVGGSFSFELGVHVREPGTDPLAPLPEPMQALVVKSVKIWKAPYEKSNIWVLGGKHFLLNGPEQAMFEVLEGYDAAAAPAPTIKFTFHCESDEQARLEMNTPTENTTSLLATSQSSELVLALWLAGDNKGYIKFDEWAQLSPSEVSV